MNQALATLKERGFFKQCTDEEMLNKKMDDGPIRIYVGVDPTGPSMHIGHMVPLFAMHHLQEAGHLPIILVGGGTARIGDPSGKSDMRMMQTVEDIQGNAEKLKAQISRFISFEEGGAKLVDNADWLAPLNYIEFLRDIGKHFSVNRMLTFEAYKMRLEKGLSFIEFNYQLLQSYDFLELYRREDCVLQIGGDDQWGNIVAGMELIRRVESGESMGLTFPLVTRSDGKKMGKTEKGAIFLDPSMTSVYEFFQYWRNVADADVEKFLLMYTFLPVEECKRLGALKDQDINAAKEILAYEQTKIIHGQDEADKAREAAKAAFSAGGASQDKSGMPTSDLSAAELEEGINVMDLFVKSGLSSSKSEARRLVSQNGAAVNGDKITDVDAVIATSFIVEEDGEKEIILKAGKKRFFRFVIK
ncbi:MULTISPECIES: tyrosine--tRNA ligase [unclassified Oceanispirochaeta]|uniref:tyrosine--tRNA ligase n=1 Tax=unclassified Oceanispirochaeta TaxID=2635722 RepID=UPI000E09B961|nr:MULTISPECIES: tyrosine--tRNA ligase [unclassified Oceanispirochaeta]MBF9014764.1 tyrosine--tRNA ligase [Oceanispirochaeta sp. M2]NPD71020.1 tyrosine--tRNA ligase [Oceanispirochaeta sp. M1]RDG33853.1 tyrosine--tRNA ligase [Oceanispirochaeta sp. M1]